MFSSVTRCCGWQCVCVCFFGAWKVPETSSGLGQRGGGNSSGGLEQTL